MHHKVVDDQVQTYTVDRLHAMKIAHEQWVRESLDFDAGNQRADELYAWILDEWMRRAEVERWDVWAASILAFGQPAIDRGLDNSLFELRGWLFARVWPRRHVILEDALENCLRVLIDFHEVFSQYAEKYGERPRTRKFYRQDSEWSRKRYNELLAEYNCHVDLVSDLLLELTRAGNIVCDVARQTIDPSFRLKEAVLTATSGPRSDLKWHTIRPEYDPDERKARIPYPGLHSFLTVRATRDHRFGRGTKPDRTMPRLTPGPSRRGRQTRSASTLPARSRAHQRERTV